jgi:hypothetical protein
MASAQSKQVLQEVIVATAAFAGGMLLVVACIWPQSGNQGVEAAERAAFSLAAAKVDARLNELRRLDRLMLVDGAGPQRGRPSEAIWLRQRTQVDQLAAHASALARTDPQRARVRQISWSALNADAHHAATHVAMGSEPLDWAAVAGK